MENIVIGFAMCGSFCTFDTVIRQLEALRQEFPNIQPILSEASSHTDSRFGDAAGFHVSALRSTTHVRRRAWMR